MPIPNANRAITADEKIRDYLHDLSHPDGGSKAVWFHSLGYSRENWMQLAEDLTAIARECHNFDFESCPFGVKFKASGMVGRHGNRPGLVFTVWNVEGDDPPRLVTAYPDDTQ